MAQRKWIAAFIVFLSAIAAQAQNQKSAGNTNTEQRPNKTSKSTQQETADTTRAANVNTSAGTDITGANARQGGATTQNTNSGDSTTSDSRASNTPAVPQTTTSQSGSPAVLSGKKGSERDGTNNVQRASMNMAGSPANGLKLEHRSSEDADAEAEDRQQHSQAKARSAQSGAQGEVINNNGQDNKSLPDQNLSAKDKKTQQDGQKKSGKKKG